MARETDIVLPGEFVVLGFLYFGAIFAVLMVVMSFLPDSGMSKRFAIDVRWIGIPYLAVTAGATPWLWVRGRKKVRQWRQEAPNSPPADNRVEAALGKPVGMSPAKRMGVGTVCLVAGLLLALWPAASGSRKATAYLPSLALVVIGAGSIFQSRR